jgi:hypothetical protein
MVPKVSVLMYKGVNEAFSQTCEMIKEDYGDINSIQILWAFEEMFTLAKGCPQKGKFGGRDHCPLSLCDNVTLIRQHSLLENKSLDFSQTQLH